MKEKTYLVFSGIVFTVIAVLHILGIVYNWPMQLGSFVVPLWVSWVCLIIAGYLSYVALRLELSK